MEEEVVEVVEEGEEHEVIQGMKVVKNISIPTLKKKQQQHTDQSSSAIGIKLRFSSMNELQKYKEIQRRTKLLYGVKDIKRMVEKSDVSKHFYQKDVTFQNMMKLEQENEPCNEEGQQKKKKSKSEKNNKVKKLRDLLKLEYFIISMNNGWKAGFDNAILIVIGYTCFTTVFFVSFDAVKSKALVNIDHLVTAFFALDFFFNFVCEYQDKETYQKVRDHKKIAIRYFKSGWMLLDFVATFPFDIVFNA
jgi:hypothetical protein